MNESAQSLPVSSSDQSPQFSTLLTFEPATEADAAVQVVSRYFDALNAEDFQTTASLFAADGTLYPPFEAAVTGREAIVAYLEAEAKGLRLSPLSYTIDDLEDQCTQCQVRGKVQTSLFGVNVGWTFVLNAVLEIQSVRVKLLAALEELLKLKPQPPEVADLSESKFPESKPPESQQALEQ